MLRWSTWVEYLTLDLATLRSGAKLHSFETWLDGSEPTEYSILCTECAHDARNGWSISLTYDQEDGTVLPFFANTTAFLDRAFVPLLGLHRAVRRLRLRGHSDVGIAAGWGALVWRIKPSMFAEVVIAILVVYGGLFAGLLTAANAAGSTLHHSGR